MLVKILNRLKRLTAEDAPVAIHSKLSQQMDRNGLQCEFDSARRLPSVNLQSCRGVVPFSCARCARSGADDLCLLSGTCRPSWRGVCSLMTRR